MKNYVKILKIFQQICKKMNVKMIKQKKLMIGKLVLIKAKKLIMSNKIIQIFNKICLIYK